jgi:DNA mismatch repair protein MutS2
MDAASQKLLEFDKIKAIVAEHCVSPLGQEKAYALEPLTDLAELSKAFEFIRELMGLHESGDALPLGELKDLRVLWKRLVPEDAKLDAPELLSIAQFVQLVARIKTFLGKRRHTCPNVYIAFNALTPLDDLERLLRSKINEKAEVRDNASPLLHSLRSQIHGLEARIHNQLEKMIYALTDSYILQDEYYTIRGDRYVLPVRAGSKGKLRGIVHGASQTGETIFIEPFELVDVVNELADLRLQEQEEVRKILISLSNAVRAQLGPIELNTALMAELDFLNAKARFAAAHHLSIPGFSAGQPLRLVKAHHPLLYLHARQQSVPLDLRLERDNGVLVISGPNAGGKTTALKTLGLLALMTQSAVPVPASADSVFPIFSNIFADIGDEQDVTQGISTFSSHIRNIARILVEVNQESLVLLDELGTATDPTEGGALAVAVLEESSSRAALTLATSHLSVLKQWAHSFPPARNASFRLDEVTKRPSFILSMDVPGVSEALIIASSVGLPAEVIERAKAVLPAGEQELTELIIALQEKEQELARLVSEADRMKEAQSTEYEHYKALREQLEQERRGMRRRLLEEKEGLLAEAKALIESKIAHLPSRESIVHAREELSDMIREVEAERRALEQSAPEELLESLREGLWVYVPEMNDHGVVKRVDQEKGIALVQLKNVEVELPLGKLRLLSEAERQQLGAVPEAAIHYTPKSDVPYELDLHGLRVEEALERVDKYLDDAALSQRVHAKLLHGYGTGALRQALHEFLASHCHVKSFRIGTEEEGGAAVTIVELH